MLVFGNMNLIANETIKFTTNAVLDGHGQNHARADRKNHFELKFGIHAQDHNVYPFKLTFFNVQLSEEERGDFITLLPPDDFPGISVDEQVVFDGVKNGQTFQYSGDLVKVNKDNVLKWRINPKPKAKERNCLIKIKIFGKLIGSHPLIPMLGFLFSKRSIISLQISV